MRFICINTATHRSMRAEFEFQDKIYSTSISCYIIYYKLTRGKKIYFCVALHASVLLMPLLLLLLFFLVFFFFIFISLASCKAIHHVETFNISTKRFISSYILFTRWHSQFVSIGLHTDHKVLHTLPRTLACMCMCSSFSILFRYCSFSTPCRPQPFRSYRCLHIYWNFR